MKIATPVLFVTILASTLVFRYGLGNDWADGLYNTVNVVATGAELHGEDRPEWAKVFLSVLKLVGAALIAAFTAIFTQYLIRAKLGGALEVRRVPDGGHVVVCGLGNIGYRLVKELTAMGERVVAIDNVADNPFIATVRRKGVPTFVGDATLPEVLKQVNARHGEGRHRGHIERTGEPGNRAPRSRDEPQAARGGAADRSRVRRGGARSGRHSPRDVDSGARGPGVRRGALRRSRANARHRRRPHARRDRDRHRPRRHIPGR